MALTFPLHHEIATILNTDPERRILAIPILGTTRFMVVQGMLHVVQYPRRVSESHREPKVNDQESQASIRSFG
jgi:hypothetical protein